MEDQPNYFNKVIQGRTKILLLCPLQALILLLMVLPCDRMTLLRQTEVRVPSPLTSENATLNPQVGEQGKGYPLHDRKELDRLGFSKSSSNVVYPISDFVSYHHLYMTHLAFALQLSSVSISSHHLSKWKFVMVEEMKTL